MPRAFRIALVILPVLFLLAVFALMALGYKSLLPGYHAFFYTPSKYQKTIQEIFRERDDIRMQYKTAFIEAQRDDAIDVASQTLTQNIESRIWPYWLGTAYDFNGNTRTPGKGKIACGYFVTTVLYDAGIPIDRNTLAQVASEKLVTGLVGEPNTRRYHNLTIGEFLSAVKSFGEGLFVVGLDTHTGFLLYEPEEVYFIHASARFPHAVVREPAAASPTLRNSKYRVLGKISGNYGLMSAWLNVRPSPVATKEKRLRGEGLLVQ
ncbi:MAG: hypothetical protein JNN12_06235 [Bacteroidetes Order II. Incertae sedis bacterium]|nr:hypothetical protein [Bacteroidetes Order II. bacterium]